MTQQTEAEAFFASPHKETERVNGRYKFQDPFGNQVTATSASNYGFPLADQFGLNKWRLRQLIKGLRTRPDLQAVLSTLDVDDDMGKVDEIIETAMQVAGTTSEANRGTAIHEALRLADLGMPYPEWAEPYVVAYRRELVRFGLTVGLIEADVYSPGLGARGRLDRTYIEADGSHVLGDIKTTGRLELQKHEISVQLAVYQSGTHIRQADGSWLAIPRGKHPLRDDYAIVVHVDREHASVTLYRADLWIGKRGANLAEQVRVWRKTGPVLLPYVPPEGMNADQLAADADQHRIVSEMVQPPVMYGASGKPIPATQPGGSVTERPPTGDEVPVEASPATQPGGLVAPGSTPADSVPVEHPAPFDGPRVTGPPADSVPVMLSPGMPAAGVPEPTASALNQPSAPVITASAFMKLSKARAQAYAKSHGATNLTRTKANLLSDLKKNGHVFAPEGAPTGGAPEPMATVTVHPAHTDQFRQDTLARIAAATTVSELYQINSDVVRQGGDQAWTQEMVDHCRAQTAAIDAQPKAAEAGTVVAIAAEILACTSTDALADVWDRVTIHGTVLARWTPFLDQTAQNHMATLAANQPAAPTNPFAGG